MRDESDKEFLAEHIDDEIESLQQSHDKEVWNACVVQALHRIYREDEQSVGRVWDRLAQQTDGRNVQTQLVELHVSEDAGQQERINPMQNGEASVTRSSPIRRLTMLVAACIAILLVGGTLFAVSTRNNGFVIQIPTQQTNVDVKPTPMPTANPAALAATPIARLQGSLIALRMVDSLRGWALTSGAILKTADGGKTWENVTPAGVEGEKYRSARGNFRDMQTAWVVSIQEQANTVTVERTLNGGRNWQSVVIPFTSPAAVDMPHFIGQEGWLEVLGSPGAGSMPAIIYHSTDGGRNWKQISVSGTGGGLPNGGFKSGISMRDNRTGFATTRSITGDPTNPGLYVTRDGGVSWQEQKIPMPAGLVVEQIGTTPPVFFGGAGFLPVHVMAEGAQPHLILYSTTDGGTTWKPGESVRIEARTVYVLDPLHAWTSDVQGGKIYTTKDGGKSWQATSDQEWKIVELSFINANEGWAITDTSLLHTTDGGKTWTPVK